ncbi:MAG: carboxypeptidase M32 [Planctomycetota bacterium]|nr:carboxypeptidase M32 [Planctomycetota bacterium]
MGRNDDCYARLLDRRREIRELDSCSHLLDWDLETYMPATGAEHRARQQALLAGLMHQRRTAPELAELLENVAPEEGSAEAACVREIKREYDRQINLPVELVEELARMRTLARNAWKEAREKKSFAIFQPWLEKIVTLKRREAEAVGYSEQPYDALLDEFEPGETTSAVESVFVPLRTALADLLKRILGSKRRPDKTILEQVYPVSAQKELGRKAATAIGFNFKEGRLDTTTHPFCAAIGPGDCRITARFSERFFPGGLFGILHEAGHGIYEQNLDVSHWGTPLGEACSMGVHESQSRLWENFVGRSRSFWKHAFPVAQSMFPDALGLTKLDEFYAAINNVEPTFIRVEADEVTYNLHIFLRFELEQALVSGSLDVADVPGAWREAFTRDFQRTPPDDAMGCLQDIHWSLGMLGYFPTYALGNVYAAQFMEAARNDLGDLDLMFARGEFLTMREWLTDKIHRHGARYYPRDLVQRVTGAPPSPEPLVRHLESKYSEIYAL